MKQQVDPLVKNGHKVFVAYDSSAFETVTRTTSKGWSSTTYRSPTYEFQKWLQDTSGPLGILWTTTKDPDRLGINIYFCRAQHAMLAKLTWGGR